jgi:CubicO group peptidase (beta-lactamase class C family)
MAHLPSSPRPTSGGPFSEATGHVQRLNEWLDDLHASDSFNGTVLVAQAGQIQFEKHCGFADVDKGIPLTARSSFSLASVSKAFTGLGIMLLAHRGKLTLDDKFGRFFPELPTYGEITIRHLLHHTSGMPDHMELADEVWDPMVVLKIEDLIELFKRYRPRRYFSPGEQFEYSNTGYAFLGEIIARVSGASYPDFMASEIFKPLGMNDSAAFNLASRECPLHARVLGFRRSAGRNLRCDLNFLDGIYGDGGIYASAEDLVRWDAGLRDGSLLPREAQEPAYVSGRLNNGEPTGYGFGWEIEPSNVVEHWGEWEGFAAFVRRDLTRHTLLVVLSNMGPPDSVKPMCGELTAFTQAIEWPAATATS